MRRTLAAGALTVALVVSGACSASVPPHDGPSVSATVVAPVAQASAITIPAIGAQSSLISIGLNPDGTMGVPPVSQPGQAAYYDGGPMPGAVGPALIVGHVNGGGEQGVFAKLHELKVGDEVEVARVEAATLVFHVTRVQQVSKTAFPWAQVLGETSGPELRLVTCGGDFDAAAHSYVDNWIVYAAL